MALIELLTTAQTTNGISGFTGRLYEVILSISAVFIAILWIPIALSFFSEDENRRMEAKLRLKNAIIGTVIYVMAVSGTVYAVFYYIATGA